MPTVKSPLPPPTPPAHRVLRKGDTLETFGTGRFTQGYFGGIMDAATGLIYVGNGQYYDPATGRFLTRDARPNQNNPYTPIDPTSALLGPLALLALAYGRRKSRGKWDMLVVLLVLSLSLGLGLAACGPGTHNYETETATAKAVVTPSPTGTVAVAFTITPRSTESVDSPDITPTLTCTATLTPTPTPSPTPIIIPNPTEFSSLSSAKRYMTYISAQELYNHYLVLWNRQDPGAWWWDVYGKDDKGQYDSDGFSFWDYVAIYMNHEASYFHTDFIDDMSEAGVRFWYERAKVGLETIGDEGFVNWWAGFSQSNAKAVKGGLFPIKNADTETFRKFRVMADNFKNPDVAWTTGQDRRRPYNWGNESAIKIHSSNSRATEMLRLNALKYPIIFRYLPGVDPFYVPSGCAQINWIDGKDENTDTAWNPNICDYLLHGQ
jgi:hypothetical protein